MNLNTVILFVLLLFGNSVLSFKILAIVTLPLHSHYLAFQTLFKELAIKGHSVTVINNFPDEKPVENLRFVNLDTHPNSFQNLTFYEGSDPKFIHYYNFYRHMATEEVIREDCRNLFTKRAVKDHLAEGIKYDVIFVEEFLSECALSYAGALYYAPIIGITSHVLLPWGYSRLGIPFEVSSHAFYFNHAGSYPNLYEKLESAVMYFLFKTLGKWNTQTEVQEVFQEYLPEYNLDIESLARERMKMMFVYQHYSITGARLLAPQLLEIAGIHIGKPKPLPKEIEDFLSGAKHGAIYVSFGSNLKSETMSDEKRQEFLDAFMNIPQKVIWKHDSENFPKGYDKIFTGKWMPQLDILCHPKVLAFVSHGGMLSLSESAHCGKPLITVPFFGDQFSNAAAARDAGLGKLLFFQNLNSKTLTEAIKDLMSSKMQQNAKRIRKLWRDRPQPVLDSAIYWTEYVARYQQAPPSLPAKNLSWFERSHIDVYSVIILVLLLVLTCIYKLYMLFIKMVVSVSIRSQKRVQGSRKKVKRN